eukprot:gene17424-biopygen6797
MHSSGKSGMLHRGYGPEGCGARHLIIVQQVHPMEEEWVRRTNSGTLHRMRTNEFMLNGGVADDRFKGTGATHAWWQTDACSQSQYRITTRGGSGGRVSAQHPPIPMPAPSSRRLGLPVCAPLTPSCGSKAVRIDDPGGCCMPPFPVRGARRQASGGAWARTAPAPRRPPCRERPREAARGPERSRTSAK